MKRPYTFGGGALAASGMLFVALAVLDFLAGPPPSNGAGILLWRDSQAVILDFVSELFFFATVLLAARHCGLLSLGDRICTDARL